jgi:hypothetical protein
MRNEEFPAALPFYGSVGGKFEIRNDVTTAWPWQASRNVILSTAMPRGGADTWDDMYRPPTQQARRLLHKG